MNFLVLFVLISSISSVFCVEDSDVVENADHENFRRLFQEKRLYQLGAVKQLQNLDPEKQMKMLDAMVSQLLTVLTKSRARLIEGGYEVEGGGLPADEQLREQEGWSPEKWAAQKA